MPKMPICSVAGAANREIARTIRRIRTGGQVNASVRGQHLRTPFPTSCAATGAPCNHPPDRGMRRTLIHERKQARVRRAEHPQRRIPRAAQTR
jgi:hypothetical protein